MAIQDLDEFDATTAFDRQILETVVGRDLLLRLLPTEQSADLRGSGTHFNLTVSDSFSGEAVAALLDRFRPLTLATGWKILDQVVELAGQRAGVVAASSGRWPISAKVKWCQQAQAPSLEPFVTDPRLWLIVRKLYARLEEPRNAVTHRQYRRGPSGEVIPYGRSGRPLRAISQGEIDALVFFSYGLSEEVVTGRITKRRLLALNWHADQMSRLTGLASRSTGPPPGLRRVIVDLAPAGRRWRLDLRAIRDHLNGQGVTILIADIEANLPDGTVFTGKLEEFPDVDALDFPASRPPKPLTRATSRR